MNSREWLKTSDIAGLWLRKGKTILGAGWYGTVGTGKVHFNKGKGRSRKVAVKIFNGFAHKNYRRTIGDYEEAIRRLSENGVRVPKTAFWTDERTGRLVQLQELFSSAKESKLRKELVYNPAITTAQEAVEHARMLGGMLNAGFNCEAAYDCLSTFSKRNGEKSFLINDLDLLAQPARSHLTNERQVLQHGRWLASILAGKYYDQPEIRSQALSAFTKTVKDDNLRAEIREKILSDQPDPIVLSDARKLFDETIAVATARSKQLDQQLKMFTDQQKREMEELEIKRDQSASKPETTGSKFVEAKLVGSAVFASRGLSQAVEDGAIRKISGRRFLLPVAERDWNWIIPGERASYWLSEAKSEEEVKTQASWIKALRAEFEKAKRDGDLVVKYAMSRGLPNFHYPNALPRSACRKKEGEPATTKNLCC